ncbi:MAG: DUF4173 domain-containing protein [Gemmatimonadetes bacterium]|nr:DUF4173 domain-containing protein [Gemmatimonadota bacterium]
MSTILLRRSAFAGALALGIAGNYLLRAPGQPALNVLIWAVAGASLLVWRRHVRGDALRGEVLALLMLAVAFAAAMVWRAAEALTLMNLALAAGLVTFAAARGGVPWLRTSGVGDWAVGVVRVGLMMAAGPFGWIQRRPAAVEDRAPVPAWRVRTRLAVRGTVLAIPALIVFTALLGSADPVFARVLGNLVSIDIADILPHVALTAILAWLTLGYLRAFDTVPSRQVELPGSPGLAHGEVAVALWLVNALFLLFVAIQVRYLFGGGAVVEVTPGLGYAEYARRGFFELVAVAALVIPLQLIADWAAAPDMRRAAAPDIERAAAPDIERAAAPDIERAAAPEADHAAVTFADRAAVAGSDQAAEPAAKRDRKVLRVSALVQLVLLAGIIASAVYRMQLYQDAYGLTELRLYVSVFMGWVTFVLLWLGATVLRGRRQHFAVGALASALLCAATLNAVNPQALIARTNVERAAAGRAYDPAYAASLGADAVPTLVRLMPRLAAADRCILGERLGRWTDEPVDDWRTWNYGEWRARRAVRGVFLDPCPGTAAKASA